MKLLSLHLSNALGVAGHLILNQKEIAAMCMAITELIRQACFDAFLWLLFDKDSQNRKDFEIKTIGPDGEYLHGLDHSVEATLRSMERKCSFYAKCIRRSGRKRGEPKAEFTGHTTDYYIDSVPVKERLRG